MPSSTSGVAAGAPIRSPGRWPTCRPIELGPAATWPSGFVGAERWGASVRSGAGPARRSAGHRRRHRRRRCGSTYLLELPLWAVPDRRPGRGHPAQGRRPGADLGLRMPLVRRARSGSPSGWSASCCWCRPGLLAASSSSSGTARRLGRWPAAHRPGPGTGGDIAIIFLLVAVGAPVRRGALLPGPDPAVPAQDAAVWPGRTRGSPSSSPPLFFAASHFEPAPVPGAVRLRAGARAAGLAHRPARAPHLGPPRRSTRWPPPPWCGTSTCPPSRRDRRSTAGRQRGTDLTTCEIPAR